MCCAGAVRGGQDAGDDLADLGAAEEISFQLDGRQAFGLFPVGRHAGGSEPVCQRDDDRVGHRQAVFDAGRFAMRERDAGMAGLPL